MWKTTLESTSKLTLELREVLAGGVDIWAFDYPSYYKGAQKLEFEQKVIDHYYFRQIGQETVGRFLHMFRAKVREIMPYYIDMYKSVEIMHGLENPFDNVDMVETFEQQTTDASSGSSNATQTGNALGTHSATSNDAKTGSEDKEHRFSNTPQGAIENLDSYMTEASRDGTKTSETINSTASAETASKTSATSEGSSTSESSGTVKHTLHRKGNQGVNTYAHDMIEFRKAIINVDEMVINELNCLFLGIY